MKSTGLAAFVLLGLNALWPGLSHAAEPDDPKFREELRKQETIYRSTDEKALENYTVNRSLEDYKDTLSADFGTTLEALGPDDRWMDIGAGTAQAILEYYSPTRTGSKARAVAISIEDRRTPLWHQTAASAGPNRIQYFFSKRMRDYSLQELGRFRIITDLIGGFSYTDELSLFMKKVLGLLEPNGTFYTLMQDVKSESGGNRPYYANSPYLTEISDAAGGEVKVCAWLKKISCVEVVCELKTRWRPPIEVYRIHKVCNDVTVPDLVRTHFQAGTPPERRFSLTR